VQNGVCATAFSTIVQITVNPSSLGGSISGSGTVCIASNSGTLNLTGYFGSVIQWETSTDNFNSVVVPVANTTDYFNYTNLTTSTYFRAQIQNSGCPIVYPTPAFIQVDPVSAGGTLTAPPVVCANTNSGVIKLAGYSGSIVRWETSNDNFISSTPVVNSTDSIEYLNLTNTTFYRAVVKNGVCPAANSNATAVTVNPASVGGNIIGAKNICIEGNGSSLILINNSGNVLQWETSNDNFLSPPTIVSNITNAFAYSNLVNPISVRALVSFSPCPAVYSDVFSFIVNPSTETGFINGTNLVKRGEGSGPLTLTNFVGSVTKWEYTTDTTAGWTSLPIASNVYIFTTLDTSIYVRTQVKSGNCPDKYSPPYYIKVSGEINTTIKIYPTISPNADQINDEWVIDNISFYPSNKVRIFNRWGDMVYEERGYDNTEKVWRGQSNTRLTVLGQDLPEGTYFYVLDPGNGKPAFSGYVVLNR
jgi:gliding motility-associated-like protein